MRLYEEIYETCAESRCFFIPLSGGYIQGVKNIRSFGENEIVLILKKQLVKVTGKNLLIAKYCDGDMQISGRIFGVEVVMNDKGTDESGKVGR
jgi:hypothetical protein